MPLYTKVGPFTNNSSPPIDKAFLDALETAMVYAQYGFNNLDPPYLLVNNDSITSGSTKNYTATGGGTGVTSGAKKVLLNVYFTPANSSTFAALTKHGVSWSNANGPLILGAPNGGTLIAGQCWVTPDGSGVIDIKAFNGNITALFVSIEAFIY